MAQARIPPGHGFSVCLSMWLWIWLFGAALKSKPDQRRSKGGRRVVSHAMDQGVVESTSYNYHARYVLCFAPTMLAIVFVLCSSWLSRPYRARPGPVVSPLNFSLLSCS